MREHSHRCHMVTGRETRTDAVRSARTCILKEQTEIVWDVQELFQLVLLYKLTLKYVGLADFKLYIG